MIAQYIDFRYLITADYQTTPNTRKIEVFLEEKAFSEENLTKLFRHLSDKNPDPNNSPNNLIIEVRTDWNQFHPPALCPPVTAAPRGSRGMDAYDFHWARFYRREGNESFVYNPVKGVWEDKDVIMKGDKIFRNGKWQKAK